MYYHSALLSIYDNSSLMGCYAVSTDTLPTFRMERRKNVFTLRMKAIRSVETSVTFYQVIPRNIPEHTNPHQYLFEDTVSFSHYIFVLRMKADRSARTRSHTTADCEIYFSQRRERNIGEFNSLNTEVCLNYIVKTSVSISQRTPSISIITISC